MNLEFEETSAEKLKLLISTTDSISLLRRVGKRAARMAVQTRTAEYSQIARRAICKAGRIATMHANTPTQCRIGFAACRMDGAGRYVKRRQDAALNQCSLCKRLRICTFDVYMEGHWNPACPDCIAKEGD